MPHPPRLASNRTLNILADAERGGYAVLAMTTYDAIAATALVRAAERARSPAILQIFPVTLRHFGPSYLRYLLDLAHSASVPISVHLDHATEASDVELAVSLAEQGIALDSIMVDASHADTPEENVAIARPYIERATACGVAVEVELGRLEGGEAGLRTITSAQLTDPSKAEWFMLESGATLLAPSVGNLHGSYKASGGPKFDLKLLEELHTVVRKSDHYLALHGTDELPDDLFRASVRAGARKINVNSWGRDPTLERIAHGISSHEPLPDTYEAATETFAGVCERFFALFGSKGMAGGDGKR